MKRLIRLWRILYSVKPLRISRLFLKKVGKQRKTTPTSRWHTHVCWVSWISEKALGFRNIIENEQYNIQYIAGFWLNSILCFYVTCTFLHRGIPSLCNQWFLFWFFSLLLPESVYLQMVCLPSSWYYYCSGSSFLHVWSYVWLWRKAWTRC